MRSPRSLADAPQVLLDRLAIPGEARSRRARPARQTLGDRGCHAVDRGTASASSRTAGRDDEPLGIRNGRVQQFDLETDNGMQIGRLRSGDESDRTIETVVV